MTTDDVQRQIDSLEERLLALEGEKRSIQSQIDDLRKSIPAKALRPLGVRVAASTPESPDEKISLFLKLFRCRENVYPKLWESPKKGTMGYSPACRNEWVRGVCNKPAVKCTDCHVRDFPPLDEKAVDTHLRAPGSNGVIGTYAIREDDTCTFLACDFDGTGWKGDIACYRSVAEGLGIQAALERSRSGHGGHAWIFFNDPIPARLARSLGTLLLFKCGELKPTIGLESYDRFFPNQDCLPKGGFGNLIALPLQRGPREHGNSVFIDSSGTQYENQWEYLASIRRLSLAEVRETIQAFLPTRNEIKTPEDDAAQITDQKILSSTDVAGPEELLLKGQTVEIGYGAQIDVPITAIPAKIVTRLKRAASFANPEFYKMQRLRMPTYQYPRFIFSGELQPDRILLPRGILDKTSSLLSAVGASVVIRDERLNKKGLKVEFSGTLTSDQESAVDALRKYDIGILSAPPGTGKTVMACALIAKRKAPTLVIVHLQPLTVQWRDRLGQFLGVNKKDIGILAGTKKKRTGKLDIAMMQTLTRMGDLTEVIQDYSQIIIDECHHIPATSFESVLKQFPARYVVGLTATPYRKDKLERVLFHQCGPIRHEIKSADGGKLSKQVIFRETGFRLPEDAGVKPAYHVLAHHLTTDTKRSEIISNDAITALSDGRFLLVISDRKDHLEDLGNMVSNRAKDVSTLHGLRVFHLDGELSAKARAEVLASVENSRSEGTPVAIFATASLIGEGFDLPTLDALILAMPISFKGRMVQYTGRLHRLAEGKTNIVVYDYVDSSCAMTLKMYRNRIKAYREMGYAIEEPVGLLGPYSVRQPSLGI